MYRTLSGLLAGAVIALATAPAALAEDCPVPGAYPRDDAAQVSIARWMALGAAMAAVPRELPVMAALEASGLRNLDSGDADSVGYFQMRLGIWNQGEYAGYPDNPPLQLKWFLDQAAAVRQARLAGGEPDPAAAPSAYGEWIADVLRPAEQYRGRYQLRLEEARGLVGPACTEPQPDPGSPGPPTAPVHDAKPPKLALPGGRSQRPLKKRALLLRVGCPGESCVVAASGTIALPGAARLYRLESRPRRLDAGSRGTLRLKLSKRLRRALRHAFADGRRVRARLTVRAVDLAGNVTRRRVTLRLKR